MSEEEFFRSENSVPGEKTRVKESGQQPTTRAKRVGDMRPVDSYRSRFGIISKMSSQSLEAELKDIANLTPLSWELPPWQPKQLSRRLLSRVADASIKADQLITNVAGRGREVAFLIGEPILSDEDENEGN